MDGALLSPDQVTLGMLIDAVPRDAVDDAVAACGVRERRSDGKLPAHVITYLTLALALFPDDDDEEVATRVTGSLDRFGCWNAAWSVPTASAITQARKRLGSNMFPELFERTGGPVAGPVGPQANLALGTARGAFLRGWRLVAIDGFEVDMPDSPDNATEFGYAGSGDNRSSVPQGQSGRVGGVRHPRVPGRRDRRLQGRGTHPGCAVVPPAARRSIAGRGPRLLLLRPRWTCSTPNSIGSAWLICSGLQCSSNLSCTKSRSGLSWASLPAAWAAAVGPAPCGAITRWPWSITTTRRTRSTAAVRHNLAG